MDPYSRAVAHSGGVYANRDQSVRFQRARVVGINILRTRFFAMWRDQGFEPDVVARTVGRLSTTGAWKQGLTSKLLMLTLCERLGCEVNEEATFRIEVVIHGLYDGARAELKAIKVVA
jgi:hypothetical protein